MTDQLKPLPHEAREPDMAKYFPGNRWWPERSDRDAYGNYLPGNVPSWPEQVAAHKAKNAPLHTGGYPYYTLAPTSPPCTKHALALRLTDTPVRVTAGGSMTPLPLDAVFVDLTGHARRAPLVTGLPGLRPLTVRVTWQDMSVPQLSADDWRVIADRLAATRRPVHIACTGGHGRTGTALAILLSMWGVIPTDADPVAWVRANYCGKAIETEAQAAYARLMGEKRT